MFLKKNECNSSSLRFSGTVIEQFVSVEILYNRYYSSWEPYEYSEKKKIVDISKLSPKQAYAVEKKEYHKKIKEIIGAYEKRIDDLSFYKEREPYQSEYEQEIKAIKKILHYLDSDMNPDRFFKNDYIDIEFCGKYLKRMKDDWWDEDEEDFVCMMAACEWVLCKMAKSCTKSLKIEEKEDQETIELRKFIENIRPHFKRGEIFYLLFAVRDVCMNQLGKPYADTVKQFAEKVAPFLEKKATSLNTQICNAGKNLKIPNSNRYYSLATLAKDQINTVSCLQKTELEIWQNRYSLVLSLVPSEMLNKELKKD